MYHSHLLINVGSNPDRPDWKVCRRWLRNLYRVHQRLCMAFPSAAQEKDPSEVHQVRNANSGFLYRIDYPVDQKQGGRQPVIIVQSQSSIPPDWDHAFGLTEGALDEFGRPIGNAGLLLAAPPQFNEVSIDLNGDELVLESPSRSYRLRPGDLLRFRLRANPTKKIQDGSRNGKRKRIEPTFHEHCSWLAGKLGGASDSPISVESFVTGWVYGCGSKYETKSDKPMRWWSVLFEGSFRAGDTQVLKSLLESGIGPAKAFGFGLLSVAPWRP